MKQFGSSCVVVAHNHNPSILNPNWLVQEGIVDKKWEVAEPLIVTPPFAKCSYVNNVNIILEPNKLSVSMTGDDSNLSSELSKIVRRYVEKLPHIPYKQQGNNFRFRGALPNVVYELKNKLIREGSWSTDNISNIKTMFRYSCESCEINLSLESSTEKIEGDDEEKDVLILDFNYHRECKDYDSVIKAVNCWNNDYQDAENRLSEIRIGIVKL